MTHPHKGRTGFDRMFHAAAYSMTGLTVAYRGESAFRQEVWAAAVMLPTACWLGANWAETALLGGSVLLVLIVELLNSGLEAAIDRISLERHELSGRAKDMGSAAVFLTVLLCGAIWTAALWHRANL